MSVFLMQAIGWRASYTRWCVVVTLLGAAVVSGREWARGTPRHSEAESMPAQTARGVAAAGDQRGRWGGRSVDPESGFVLSASIVPLPGEEDLFDVRLRVHHVDGSGFQPADRVVFHLHPSFEPNTVTVRPTSGTGAEVTRRARGPFTVGAEILRMSATIRLELDLATVADAPRGFKDR